MSDRKTALITGITGQDGAFLTKLLLSEGFEVMGLLSGIPERDIFVNFPKLGLDENKVKKVSFEELSSYKDKIDHIYNLTGQSSVGESWKNPSITYEVNLINYSKLLDIFRGTKTRILQACSAEMYDDSIADKVNEVSIINPSNPYAISKYSSYRHGQLLRKSDNMFISNAILFNHESELRPTEFVTRKITLAAANWAVGNKIILQVGNINAERDWGYAGEYVESMYKILCHDTADDFIISTGEKISVRKFIELAFEHIGVNISWHGEGLNEQGTDSATGEVAVKINPEFFRPIDKDAMVGDSSKIERELGWKAKIKSDKLVMQMVDSDIQILKKGK